MHNNAATISDSICQACDRFYAGTPTPSPYPPPPLCPQLFASGIVHRFGTLVTSMSFCGQICNIPSAPNLHRTYSSA
jgi:hypothetical protein